MTFVNTPFLPALETLDDETSVEEGLEWPDYNTVKGGGSKAYAFGDGSTESEFSPDSGSKEEELIFASLETLQKKKMKKKNKHNDVQFSMQDNDLDWLKLGTPGDL